MDARALTVAIRLLCASVAAVGVTSLEGCCVGDPWGDIEAIELGTDADLHAVVAVDAYVDERSYEHVAVGSGGAVVVWGRDALDGGLFVVRSTAGDQDLRAIWADPSVWWVVGDGGTVAFSDDLGATWTPVDVGTTANLRGITSVGSRLIVVGDEIVLVQGADGIWTEMLPPEGAWGSLRAIHFDGTRIYAIGLGGVIWSALDPVGPWIPEASGISTDLFAIGEFESAVTVVGADGRLLMRESGGGWSRPKTDVSVDLVGYDDGVVLAADGRVFEIGRRHKLRELDRFGATRAIVYDGWVGLVVVGDGGGAYSKAYYQCVGGRPFVVDGRAQLPALIGHELRPERGPLAAELARRWAEDGLVEHASVASFARFGLELLALGAPPGLLRAVSTAMLDELHHARLCFGLARRFGGVAVEPGPMPLPRAAFERARDPVAVALALFDEGCVNESLAACEAADAASVCRDAETRAVLEILASDERRHAATAWIALRWLLEAHGDRVRGPIRARVARLVPSRFDEGTPLDPRLAEHGRLSPERRAEVHRRVHAELIRPLASALLDGSTSDGVEVA